MVFFLKRKRYSDRDKDIDRARDRDRDADAVVVKDRDKKDNKKGERYGEKKIYKELNDKKIKKINR